MLRIVGTIEQIDDHKIILKTALFDVICEYVGIIKNILVGDEINLYVYAHIKETINFYAFVDLQTLSLFKKLLTVRNVSYHVATSLLQKYDYEEFKLIIATRDLNLLTKVPKVGVKTADLIIKKMKTEFANSGDTDQIVSYLCSLGYEKSAVMNCYSNTDSKLNTEEKIVAILKMM